MRDPHAGRAPDPVAGSRTGIQAVDLVDVFVYLVVLGLFVQFLPAVISESFALTLLTAVLLKLALEVVMAVKKRVLRALKSSDSFAARFVAVITLVLLLPGSKFAIIWLTDWAFGGAVELGGFFAVTLLILALMVARGLVRLLLAPPPPTEPSSAPTS